MRRFMDWLGILVAAGFAALGMWEIWKMPLTISDYVIIAATAYLVLKGIPLLARYPAGKRK